MHRAIFPLCILAITVSLSACSALTPVVQPAEATPQPRPEAFEDASAAEQASAAATTAFQAPAAASLYGSDKKDVAYCSIGGTDLKMDIVYPRQGEMPFPVVVFIHGGGWSEGDKADVTGAVGTAELLENGYVLVSINYRLAPGFRFPTMIEDSRCAIRSLRAHAEEWALDPDRIGVMGASAGAHLAALLGTGSSGTSWKDEQDYDDPYAEESSTVQAVVDLYGPADLPGMFATTAQNLAQSAFGVKSASDPFLLEASPIQYVSEGDAPVLILHGTQDLQVPLEQSQAFDAALEEAGIESTLIVVEGAGHGFPRSGQEYSPDFDELARAVLEFFNRHLGS